MLPNPEERKRLRAEKAAQQAEKQRKKLRIQLIAAAVVVLLCGVLIFALSRKKPQPDISQTQPSQQTQTMETTVPESTKPAATVIHYAAVGDLNINDATVAAGGTGYDYTAAFLDVAHLLADADIASVNFEGNLVGEPYGSTFSAPQTMMTALQKAGVDLVQMANSYSINRGVSGLVSSIDAVRAAGMEPLGV